MLLALGDSIDSKKVDRVRSKARNVARKAKKFKEADRIRDELKAMGVVARGHAGWHPHLGGQAMMSKVTQAEITH